MFSRLEKAAIARLTGGGGGEESSFFPTKESGTVLIKNYVPPPQLYVSPPMMKMHFKFNTTLHQFVPD